ncbi:SDR family NAD(P)-dependent oxidoreductase [Bacillus sp. FJAT-45350]|uniref:SDR family NAD(P)-dependent oxidoreductase n=1 Tax=Bacillus sp. FJAT-45350 TaxID=2011014 RepID=UPI00211B7F51|nr:SDR family oxidoreductase [Bacillus sp. FJAT-45350]
MSQLDLKDKVIVITGASSGLGWQLAIDAARAGAIPILMARSTAKLQELHQFIETTYNQKAYYYTLDVCSPRDIHGTFQTVVSEHKKIDALINNAGFAIFETFLDADLEDMKEMFDVNVLGLMACTKAVLPEMVKENRGHIINIASQAGKISTPKSSVYAATKHAVLGFTNSLRMELHETNIHVSAVNPGPIRTPFFTRADQEGTYVKNIEKFMLEPSYVSMKILSLLIKPKREVNLPYWMNIGSRLYQLFPSLVEKLGGKSFYQK